MNEVLNQANGAEEKSRGVFVETALTNEQVERAIVEELRLGIGDATCAFLGDFHDLLDVPAI